MGNISKLTPILYDKGETNFNHNGLGKLTKLLVNEIDEVLNGELEAFFEYPANGHLADEIDNEMFIKAKPNKKDEPHVFKIYDYELDTFTQTYLIYARSKNIEDLRNNVILNANVKDLAPTQAWNLAKNNALDPVVTTFYSDITTTSSVHWERRSLLSTIAGQEGSMIQYWGGEIKHDINRISLLRRRGQDNVTTVRHGKNLDGLKATYSTKGLVTAIVPYYVKSDDKSIYGNVVKSQYINNYPSTYYDIIEYNDEALGLTQEDEPEGGWEDSTIRTELNRVAKRYFDENVGKDLPSINMEISLEDISQTKEYENFKDFEQIEIGDTITVYSKKFDLNINAKVRRVVYNGLTDKNELVEVGTARRSLYDDVRDEFKKVETELKEGIDHAMASADGKNTIYHGTADPNEVGLVGKNNDTYLRTNGQFKEIWSYLDGQWHLEVGDLTGEQIKADIAEQQQAIEEAKQTADEAVDRINTDIAGKFTALDEEILAIESISNSAQANAQTALTQSIDALGDASLALTNAQTAINTAGSAISSIQDINMEIDEINGTLAIKADSSTVNAIDGTVSNLSTEVGIIAGELSLKANSSTVDTLTGRVSTAESGITANANAIQLKANQSTVDTLAGTVSSLGTDIGIVAGQISSKVWSTDIQTAVDGIEVGGRNLVVYKEGFRTYSPYNLPVVVSGYSLESEINKPSGTLNIAMRSSSFAAIQKPNSKYVISGYFYLNDEPIPVDFFVRGFNTSEHMNQKSIEIDENGYTVIVFETGSAPFFYLFHTELKATTGDILRIDELKVEKGNIATDWTPAPEDTTALINHVESELTQKYDSITAAVSSLDGRVAQQKLTLDGLTTTIQDVRKDLTGTTTLLNTTRTTVSGHTSTIATLRTDVDGKATTAQFNTLNSTVNGTVQRVGNAEGKITTIESNVSGLQTTVASKANQSQVTQLANAVNTKVTASQVNESILADKRYKDTRNDNQIPSWYYSNYTKETVMEFKNLTAMGIPGEGDYGVLETIVPWSNWSGGGIKQTLRTDYGVWEREQYGSSTWKAWRKTADRTWVGAQISVLEDNINLRVAKGDLLSQINIEAGRTLIQSDKLLLDANNTVITGTAWMDGAVIANASIDGAKIQDATIGSAKIASLDVSKISGNTTEFVRSVWNAGLDNVTIDASGVYMTGSGAWRRTYLSATGFDLYNGVGGGNKAGAIGYLKPSGSEATYGENVMGNAVGGRHMIGIGVNASHDIAFGYNNDSTTNRFFKKSLQINGDTGIIRLFRPITTGQSIGHSLELFAGPHRGSPVIGWTNGGNGRGRIYLGENVAYLESGNSIEFYAQTGKHLLTLRETIMARQDIFMDGNEITGTSDARLKTNISNTRINSLEEIKNWNFVDFEWIDDKQKGVQFGLLAQETSLVSEYDKENDLWGISMSKQVMVNSHAIQQVALMEENTNKVASRALQLVESIKSEIDELREENRDLRNRIEELESAA